ncbi:AraC-type DNA-binding protein [Paenibacillus sp. UNCCL117]|uniref:helix-turn-helix domain-containing protein n=1 Tax=unclassified Paenibacillus TaxID=185978 RepID=UPI000885CEE7|nr:MULTISPECIES: AraC family transcriptional regulator [unclassified Paenibacillus]SDC93643.1 AraC-type DNA-binding protein [Paenibacillus sp. cl123]SFW29606.1 AraC-type DNA-binding protein [Paenibacillus sp. UNCCL117]
MNPYQLVLDTLEVRFLHITEHLLDYRWHIRDRVLRHSVLWLVEQGAFSLVVNGTSYSCQPGDVCVLPAQGTIGCRAISSDIRLISINFDAKVTWLGDRSWEQAIDLPVVFSQGGADVRLAAAEMLANAGNPSPFLLLLMQSGLLRILFHLVERLPAEQALAIQGFKDPRIHTVVRHLLAHPDRMPEVAELAELAELSESHLRKLFIQHTGLAPLPFVHQLKIEQAKKLLASTAKPISLIADQLGVNNANYFTRLFKGKTGLTPQQYRQQFGLWIQE